MEIANSIIKMRSDFGKYEEDKNFRVFDIALPVAAYECSANVKVESEIDSLAKSVLKFLKIGIKDNSEIAELLSLTPDMVERVKKQKLYELGFIDDSCAITQLGEKCLSDEIDETFREERIYGNMYVNLADGEVMPFFLEGSAPRAKALTCTDYPSLYKICPEKPVDTENLYIPYFTEAYKKHHMIKEFNNVKNTNDEEFTSEEGTESFQEKYEPDEFDMLSSEFEDVLYYNIDNIEEYEEDEESEEVRTLADAMEEKKEEDLYVKPFNSTKKILYLYTKMIVNRNRPEDFVILSPFPDNVTTWYTKRIPYMQVEANNIMVKKIQQDEKIRFREFTQEITREFIVRYPELADTDFNFFTKTHFPNLANLNITDRKILSEVLKRYYNSYILNCNGKNSSNEVLDCMAFSLETILNIFISKINNRASVCNNSLLVPYNKKIYRDMFERFGLADCSAQVVAFNLSKKIRNWGKVNARIKGSITEKYCFLILEGYIHSSKPTPFIKVIKENGREFIEKLDCIIEMRNKYTSHNDNVDRIECISAEDFEKTKKDYIFIVKAMINVLYEAERGE